MQTRARRAWCNRAYHETGRSASRHAARKGPDAVTDVLSSVPSQSASQAASAAATAPPAAPTSADALRARLEDPQVAAALTTIVDHADVLALAVVSVDGLLRRADTLTTNLSDGLKDVKVLGQSAAFLAEPTKRLAEDAPKIADAATALLDSGMLSRDVVDLLGRLAGALVEGEAAARRNGTTVSGPIAALRSLKDPEVGRGLGLLVEVARALGRTV